MSEIRISVTLSLDEKHPEDGYIDFNLSVDGQYLHEVGVYIDPVNLVTSASISGEFFIYTCDCGNPACQGIEEGVNVSHTPETVVWRLKNPISWPRTNLDRNGHTMRSLFFRKTCIFNRFPLRWIMQSDWREASIFPANSGLVQI